MVSFAVERGDGKGSRLKRWDKTTGRPSFYFGVGLVALSILSGLATYLILTGLTPIVPNHSVVVTMLLINGVLALAMIGLIAWQVAGLWIARRRQQAGARLHVRIVGLFSVIAVLPAILLAVFASVSLDRGLDHWFSKRTKLIVENSVDVATAYLNEHGQVIRSDVISMAADIDEAVNLFRTKREVFWRFLAVQASIRSIPVAYIIDEKAKDLVAAGKLYKEPYAPPPKSAMEKAMDGKAVVIAPGTSNKVAAIKKLENFQDRYLYIVRPVNPQVLQLLRETRASEQEYQALSERRTGVQMAFALMYVAIALTLLLAAIWGGLWFANRLVSPIRKLIGAAQKVSKGDLDVQVETDETEGDLKQLGTTFNDMTHELQVQRDQLVDTNAILDERRRFIETVLSGVTAGVIGLDTKGIVTLANPSAETLLASGKKQLVGQDIASAVPEFAKLFERGRKQGRKPVLDQITLVRGGQERNFAVRVTSEHSGSTEYGYVITFDDVTELVTAQRSTAWADIARRIAHEIKNPLTPIQLSAERIRRKYGDSITEDREVFDRCTDTIVRQVEDIGRMVDEFSAFARMPKPNMENSNVGDIAREAVFLFQVSHPDITFEIDLPSKPVFMNCDRRLMSQAITNLVKNASEAIEPDNGVSGKIITRVRTRSGRVIIEVIDNGKGLPKENRNRLVEPYMTTREKGTGLGLAIVQKITEQHGGRLQLRDAPKRDGKEGGACVRLDFPAATAVAVDEETAAEPGPARKKRTKTKTPAKSKSRTRASGKRTAANRNTKRTRSKKRSPEDEGVTHGV
ncbi:MAG: ATP-binding protein [Hyphomicrobiaceae bacterium]|nr:ATP-binding protein [Hyphomicrobiaceae bacterium]